MKYNQCSWHCMQAKPVQDIPTVPMQDFLPQGNYKCGSNFPLNALQAGYADKHLVIVWRLFQFSLYHILCFPVLYLFRNVLRLQKIYSYAIPQQCNKKAEG